MFMFTTHFQVGLPTGKTSHRLSAIISVTGGMGEQSMIRAVLFDLAGTLFTCRIFSKRVSNGFGCFQMNNIKGLGNEPYIDRI